MPTEVAVGIFGGTFDPVHFGHLRLAEEAADTLGLAKVRWIPAGQPALRDTPRVGPRQRLDMVRLAIADNPRFELDTAEVDAEQKSFTVPTLERLRRADVYGSQQPLVLLVGADAFAGMAGWHRWRQLFELAHIAVAHRPGYAIEAAHLPAELADVFRQRACADPQLLTASPAGSIVTFAMTPLDISATRIRTLLSNHSSARYLAPDCVLEHIRTHHFYTEN
ncbi:nicotinate-nucleotide adenylyltransferase [Propionivibrio sp.]|jgi:nicotinate-nucleotide adenylyltransferase|uniref:nicotinate-nucleotide adenylyltransferase n=1 Tax=Propionivibrio sp. TaxID=2212460 RepID=UPI00272E68B1|nr:nicotinate-nucleotide adenylyltransferase [Propionivibrio sp.]